MIKGRGERTAEKGTMSSTLNLKGSTTYARVHHEGPHHYLSVQQMTAPAHFCSRKARAKILLVTRIYSIRHQERVFYLVEAQYFYIPSMC